MPLLADRSGRRAHERDSTGGRTREGAVERLGGKARSGRHGRLTRPLVAYRVVHAVPCGRRPVWGNMLREEVDRNAWNSFETRAVRDTIDARVAPPTWRTGDGRRSADPRAARQPCQISDGRTRRWTGVAVAVGSRRLQSQSPAPLRDVGYIALFFDPRRLVISKWP